jgi:hypothetical protein
MLTVMKAHAHVATPLVGRVTGTTDRVDVSGWAARLLDLRARQLRVANAALLRALGGDGAASK